MLVAAGALRGGATPTRRCARSTTRAAWRRSAPTCCAAIGQHHARARRPGRAPSPPTGTPSRSTRTSPRCASTSRSCCRRRGVFDDAERELRGRARRRCRRTPTRRSRWPASAPRRTAHARGARRCWSSFLERDPYHFDGARSSLGESLLRDGAHDGRGDRVHARAALRSRRTWARSTSRAWCSRRRAIATRGARAAGERVRELEPASALRAPRAARCPHRAATCGAIFVGRAAARRVVADGDRRPAPRTRHPRRLPAPRPEPEDGTLRVISGAARQRGDGALRERARSSARPIRSNPHRIGDAARAVRQAHRRRHGRGAPAAAGSRGTRGGSGEILVALGVVITKETRAADAAADRGRGLRADVVAEGFFRSRRSTSRRTSLRRRRRRSRPSRC